MINIRQVREVHLELTTNCNASCPLCPRNYFGYPHNAGYPITELSLEDIKTIFQPEFLAQLNTIRINGNLGDFLLAKDNLEIVDYFRQHNSTARIDISTNGSARNAEFWKKLALSNPVVRFALDGLEDTHHLYRVNTNFNHIIKNAQAYIQAGGFAVWKMIKFDHNAHQVEQCREMAYDLGFADFVVEDHGRNDGPVFDRDGNLSYTIGSRTEKPQENVMFYMNRTKVYASKQGYLFNPAIESREIDCVVKGPRKTIYVAANGDVYPCCWTGFFPRTFDHTFHYGNEQIKELLGDSKNNALEQPLEDCLAWFSKIEQAWKHETFAQGRPFICVRQCGRVQ
jgi:MoaA/NifB/PqqE/SkfB family radical SAM enzyme